MFHAASWNTSPSVKRSPERTADTPCRTGAADQPRVDCTGRSRVVNTKPWPCGSRVAVPRDWARGRCSTSKEFTAGVVHPRFAQVDDHLQRKHQVPVQVSMQRVPVALAVLEQDGRRLGLAGRMAHVEPVVEGVRPRRLAAQFGPPIPRDRQQPRIQRLLELFDRLGVRPLEVPVFALAEPVPAHVDGRAEQVIVGIELTDLRRLGRV